MSEAARVLVVDDRSEARELLARDLEEAGYRVLEAGDGIEGWQCFRRADPDLVVTDLRMPKADGIELLRRIRTVSNVPVILLTAYGDVPTAVSAMKGGAQEVFHFPDDLDRLIPRIRELAGTGRGTGGQTLEETVAGRSVAMRRVRERICALAPLTPPVLVRGETGAGRDCVARALCALGPHADAPFVSVRAGEGGPARLPNRPSVYYLDEVGRLSPDEQSHWRKVLGGIDSDRDERIARILASTSEDLEAVAREGRFDPDLARALHRFSIVLPPLRNRIEDVSQLVPLLARRIGARLGRPEVRFERAALALLKRQLWPGNVRELAALVEKLVAFSAHGTVTRDRVREVLGESPDGVAALRSRRNQREREELMVLLEECGGNLAEVARRLDISRGAVIYRAQKHGLVPRPR